MARNLIVEIIGESKQFVGEMEKAEAATGRFGHSMGKLSGMAKFAGVALIGGVAAGLAKSVEAAMNAQASQANLEQSLRRTHQSIKAMTPAIDAAESASRKLGFTDEDTAQAMARLEIATGSTKKSISELNVVQDLARTRHMDLTHAANALAQAQTGSQRAAKQLGIIVVPVTAAVNALKASHENLKTAVGQADLAQAKLTDKMATGQAVIQAVTDKVKGQAQAFASTAAGGMAAFHAQLESLEVKIGTALLPALTKVTAALASFVNFLSTSPGVAKAASAAMKVFGDVMHTLAAAGALLLGWYQRHQTAAKAIIAVLAGVALALASPIVVIGALGVALIELYNRSQRFRDIVNAAFQAVSNKIHQIMPTIRAVIAGVVATVEAIWRRFGSTLISVAATAGKAVIRVLQDLASIIGSVFSLIGDLIHGRWSKVWDDMKNIVSHAFDALKTIFVAEATIVGRLALAIGKAILDGILHGVEGLGSSLFGKLKDQIGGAVSAVKSAFGIFSPSKVTSDEIGRPLGEGVILGWLLGSAALPAKMSQSLQNAIQAGQQVIQNAQSAFQASFASLTSIADNALSSIAGSKKTKTEKLLDKIVSQHDAAAFKANLETARQAVADAQATLDAYLATANATPAQLQAVADATTRVQLAQDKLNAAVKKYGDNSDQAKQATLNLHAAQDAATKVTSSLGIDPAQVAQDKQAVVAAQQQVNDLLYQQRVAALQKTAAEERKQQDAQNAVRQLNFDKQLAALEAHLAKTGASAAQSQEAILKLFAKYGVNFAAVGRDMGIAWVAALKAAIQEAAGSAGELQGAISKLAAGIRVPKPKGKATGGPVFAGIPYEVGERGRELFVPHTNGTIMPNGSYGDGGMYEIHNHVYLDGQQITESTYRGLLKKQKRVGNLGLT